MKHTTQLLRFGHVMDKARLSRASIYALSKRGLFPTLIRVHPRDNAWLESKIYVFPEERIQQRPAQAMSNAASAPTTER